MVEKKEITQEENVRDRGINMVKFIRKRDGRLDHFDINKIAVAIYKSLQATDASHSYEEALLIANDVFSKLVETDTELPTVELIQDIVEETLIEKGYIRTAKAYILYRADRTRFRERKSQMMKTLEEITYHKTDASSLNVSLNETFDVDTDFVELTKSCTPLDVQELFLDGFTVSNHMFREPSSISTYSALLCIAIESMQGDISVMHFDSAMAIGVRKSFKKYYFKNLKKCLDLLTDLSSKDIISLLQSLEVEPTLENKDYFIKEKEILSAYLDEKLISKIQTYTMKESYEETDKETYQAMEALVHNLNTMNSRSFLNKTLVSLVYGRDTSKAGRMVINNILLTTDAGVGNGETASFPVQIFEVEDNINAKEDDPNYDLFLFATDVSTKRIFPYFSYIKNPN